MLLRFKRRSAQLAQRGPSWGIVRVRNRKSVTETGPGTGESGVCLADRTCVAHSAAHLMCAAHSLCADRVTQDRVSLCGGEDRFCLHRQRHSMRVRD